MFYSADLFDLLCNFGVFSIPYIFARCYSASKNEILILFILLVIIIIGWLSALIMLIFVKKRIYVVCVLTLLLNTIDMCSGVLSIMDSFALGKAIAVAFNISMIILISLYMILCNKEQKRSVNK